MHLTLTVADSDPAVSLSGARLHTHEKFGVDQIISVGLRRLADKHKLTSNFSKRFPMFPDILHFLNVTEDVCPFQAYASNITIKVLDILTFVVPPLLSAGMTFATGFAQRRLLKKGIRCISVKYICLTGGLDMFCFDKVRQNHVFTPSTIKITNVHVFRVLLVCFRQVLSQTMT